MATLRVIYPEDQQLGREFPLSTHEVIVGRDENCAVRIESDSVSRHHARIFFTGDAWIVEDLKSTNGCAVNDVPTTRSALRDRDALKIGGVILQFRAAEAFEVLRGEDGGGAAAPAQLSLSKPDARN